MNIEKQIGALKAQRSSLIIAPTHGECRAIAGAVRKAMKQEGLCSFIESCVPNTIIFTAVMNTLSTRIITITAIRVLGHSHAPANFGRRFAIGTVMNVERR